MKKYIILFLVIILIGCSPLSVVAQENEFIIKTENVTALQGDTIAVKFSFENNPGISLFTFELNYDKTKLSLKEINGNSLMGGSFIDNVNEDFILWMSSGEDTIFNGTAFTAVFEIFKNTSIGQTEVSVSLPYGESNILNYNGDDIEIQVVSGYVNIKNSVLYGDANNDGEINSLDLAKLRAVLLFGYDYIDNVACDTNGDGLINILDFLRLERYIAGDEVSLGTT